jgi:hypothetical protein
MKRPSRRLSRNQRLERPWFLFGRSSIAEREAREKELRMETESVAALASAHGEAKGFAQRIALLEAKLTDARQA